MITEEDNPHDLSYKQLTSLTSFASITLVHSPHFCYTFHYSKLKKSNEAFVGDKI